MGNKGNERRKIAKMKQTRSRRAANTALYENWRDSGRNSKSKRFRLKQGRANRPLPIRNNSAKNIGDINHHPSINMPFLVKTYLMAKAGIPNQFTGRYPGVVSDFIYQNQLSWCTEKQAVVDTKGFRVFG